MLVEIFALLPHTNLPSLAQTCTKFHHILHIDSIWKRRCREEYGQLDYSYRGLLNVMVDGLCITGWTYRPSLNTHVDGPMQFEPSFRIRLTERKSTTVEYMDNLYSFSHSHLMQIQKDRFSIQWIKRDHRKDSPTRLRRERGRVLVQEDRLLYDWLTYRCMVLVQEHSQRYDCQTYRRVYLPRSHPDDLIRPGLFHGKYDAFGLMIAMLSFHGKYARVTKITGDFIGTLEIHLMRRIQLLDGKIFRNFKQLSRMVHEIDEQVIWEREQQQQQQQQENWTEKSEGHGWQSPAQPSVGESGAAASEEQPVPFVLPVGVRSRLQNYPRTCRMCFYGVYIGTLEPFAYHRRFPGVFILFDENHLGFIVGEEKLKDIKKKCLAFQEFLGCEGHLAVTSVTPLIAKIDSAALTG
ncbi:PREDICTED: F-box only protein 31-like [Myotis brandtii]|uniref:F-box only protein 31-like n=1 Tax=Myotis brandtii TaxID=109478 RepID=UPI0007042FED|nr:PREDICTED: F-box only protein 31-like [Myotis brandtii]